MALSEERRRRLEEEQRKAVQNNLRAAAERDAATFDLLEQQRARSQQMDYLRRTQEALAQAHERAARTRQEDIAEMQRVADVTAEQEAYDRSLINYNRYWRTRQDQIDETKRQAERARDNAQRRRDYLQSSSPWQRRVDEAKEQLPVGYQYGAYQNRTPQDALAVGDTRRQAIQNYETAKAQRDAAVANARSQEYQAQRELKSEIPKLEKTLEYEKRYGSARDTQEIIRAAERSEAWNPNAGFVALGETGRAKSIAKAVYQSATGRVMGPSDELNNKISFMTDAEVGTVLNLANQGKWSDLLDYTSALQAELDARAFDAQQENIAQMSRFGQAAYGMLGAASRPLAYAQIGVDKLTGNYTDLKSGAVGATRLANEARARSLEGLSQTGQFLGNALYSTLDNAALMPLGEVGALVWMSAGAAGQTAIETLERGGTEGQALGLGAASGAVEYLTEKLPLENLFRIAEGQGIRGLKDYLKTVAKQMGTEGAEEIISEFADTFLDRAIMGQKSEYLTRIRELEKDEGLTHDEAVNRANYEFFVKNPGLAGAAGALSGGLMAGASAGINAINTRRADLATGWDITDNRQIADVVLDEGMKSTDQRIRDEAYRLDAIRKTNERTENFQWSAADQRRIGEIYDALDNDSKARVGQEAGIREAEREAEINEKIAEQAARDQEERDRNMTPEEFDEEIRRRAEASGNNINMDNPETMVAEEPAAETEQTNRRGSDEYTDRVETPEDVDADMRRRAAAAEEATRTGDRSVLDNLERDSTTTERRTGNSDEILGKNTPVPTEDDIRGGNATYGGIPVLYDANEKAEASSWTSEIHVSNKFFELSPENQRHVLNHEIAHNLSDELMSQNTDRWNEFASNFITEKEVPQGSKAYESGQRTYWEGLYGDIGATALSETVTRAVTEYLDDPDRLKARSPQAFNAISQFMSGSAQSTTAQTQSANQTVTPEQAARQTADNARRAGLSAEDTLVMSNIARDVGARLEFQQMRDSRIHGFYNRETGTIVLNQDLSTAEMAWSTFAHEITHHSETAGSYKQLAALAKRFVGETAQNGDEDDAWNAYIRQKRRQYADVGYYTSQQDAEFEAVANTIENILTSREAMEGVARYSREDAQALLASIDDVLDRTTTNSTAITPESARLVQAQKALAAALGEVREQRATQTESATATQTTGNSPDSEGTTMVMDNDTPIKQYSISTTVEPLGLEFTKDENGKTILLDKNGKAVDNVTKDMVMNSDYGALIRATTKSTDNPNGVITEKEADAEAQFLADTIQLMLKTQDIDLIWAVNSAIGFNPIKPGEVAKSTNAKGKFAALTSNSDPQYGTTIDFTTICKKTQAVIDVMSETMKRTHKGLTSDEVIKIVYDEVAKAGEPVPCPVCYVFSRWVGLGGLFDSMNSMQNQYPVGMDVSEIRSDIASLKKRIEAFAGKNFSDKKSKFYKNLVNEQAALEKKKFDAENLGGEPLTSAENERLETITKQIRYIDQWTWLTKVRLNKNYEKQGFVPPDILFDINAGKKFAESYPLAWKYRTSRGPAMGKAATPYADEHIGQIIRGIAVPNAVKKHQLGDLTRDPFLGTEGELGNTALKTLSMAQANARKQNMLNGQRLQSTSDFRYEYALDYLMAFFELQSIGSKAQMYTKVPEMISMAASCGLEVNCSLMPLNDGYDENDNLIFSDVTGMNAEDAFRYSAIYNCVQPIIVGINPKHVRLCMRDPRITFCIPFHASGGTEDNYVSMMQSVDETVTNRTDFSHYQNDTVMADATPEQKAAYSARLKILTGKASSMTAAETNAVRNNEILSQLHARLYGTDVDGNAASVDDMYLNPDDRGSGRDSETYQTFLTSDQAEKIMPYEFWDKNATRDNERVNGDRFVKYCESLGVHARFSGWSDTGTYNPEMDFTNEDGYWKVIPDRKMYNNDGTYHVQQAVNISNFQAEYLLPSEADKNIVKPSRANDRSKVSDIADKAWARISEARANEASRYKLGMESPKVQASLAGNDWEADVKEAVRRYGRMKPGVQYTDENGKRITHEETMANAYEDGKRARKGYRTAAEANVSDPILKDIRRLAVEDQYVPTSDEKNVEAAKEMRGKASFDEAYTTWNNFVQGASPWTAKNFAAQVAFGQQLYLEALRNNDGEAAIRILTDLAEFETRLGQGVQAASLLKKLSPEGQIIRYKRIAETEGQRLTKKKGKVPADVQAVKEAEGVSDALMKKLAELRRLKKMQADGEKLPETEVRRIKELQVEIDDLTKDLEPMRNILDRLKKRRHEEAIDVGKLKRELKWLEGTDEKSGKLDILMHEIQELTDEKNQLDRELIPKRQELERKIKSEKATREERNALARELRSVNHQINKNLQLTIEHQREIAEIERNLGIRRIELQSKLAEEGMTRTRRNEMAKELRHTNTVINNLNKLIAAHQQDILDFMADMNVKEATVEELRQYEKLVRGSKAIMNTYRRYVKNKGGEVVFPDELAEQYIKAKTAEERDAIREQIDQTIADQLPGTWGEKIRAVRYMSMLLNPTTHIRNIFGNIGQFGASGISDALNAGIESIAMKGNTELYQKALDKIAEYRERIEETRNNKTYSKEFRDTQLERLNKGMEEAYRELAVNERRHAVVTPWTDKELYKAANEDYKKIKDDLQAGGSTSETEGIEKRRKIFTSLLGQKIGEPLRNFSTDTLEREDSWFLEGSYTRSFAQYLKANGIDPKTATEDQMNRARSVAFFEAMRNTYRDPSVLANKLNEIERLNPFMELLGGGVMPYKKTPINVAKRGFEYSPLGLVRSLNDLRMIATHKASTRTKAQMLEDFCHAFTGTALFALGILGQRAGRLFATPGEGDKDRDKKLEEATGRQDYSIRIGNYTYTMDWLAPIVMPLFSGVRAAEAFTQMHNGLESEDDWSKFIDSALEGFVSTMNPMFEMTMLDGITSLMKNYQSEGSGVAASVLWSALESYALQFFPTVGGKLARVIDPYQRSTMTTGGTKFIGKVDRLKRKAMAKIPGLTFLLPEKEDRYGDAVLNFGGNMGTRFLYNMVSPGYIKEITHLETDEETKRLYAALQELDPNNATKVLAKDVPTSIKMDGATYYLSPEDYKNYAVRMGQQAKSDLETLYASEDYRKANTTMQSKMVADIWTDAAEAAKRDYFEDIGVLDDYLRTKIEPLLYDNSTGETVVRNLADVREIYEQGRLDLKTVEAAAEEIAHTPKTGAKIDTLNGMIDKYHLTQDEYDFLYMTKIADQYMQDDMQAVLDAGGTLDQAINTVARFYHFDPYAVDSKTGETGMWVKYDKGTQAAYLSQSKLSAPAKEAFYLNNIVSTNNVEKEQAKIEDYYKRNLSFDDYLKSLGTKYDDEGTAYENNAGFFRELYVSDLSADVKEAAVYNLARFGGDGADKAQADIDAYKKSGLTVQDYILTKASLYDDEDHAYTKTADKAKGLLESGLSDKALKVAWYTVASDAQGAEDEINAFMKGGNTVKQFLKAKAATSAEGMKSADKAKAILDLDLKSFTSAITSIVTTSENKAEGIAAVLNAGVRDRDVATAYAKYAEINAREDLNGTGKAREFAMWLDRDSAMSRLSAEQKAIMKDAFRYYNMVAADAGKYDSLMKVSGMSSKSAESISKDLAALEPLPGAKSVSESQRRRAIAYNTTASEKEIDAAMYLQLDSTDDGKEATNLTNYKRAREAGLSAKQYVDYSEKLATFTSDRDANGKEINGRKKQDKIVAYINGLPISRAQKNALWFLADYKESTLKKQPWY